MNETYFPLRIEYVDTKEIVVVDSPEEIKSGVTFKVLNTNWEEER